MKWQPDSKVLIQGINEPLALHYAKRMKAAGTNIVAGIDLDSGEPEIDGIPLFNLVEKASQQVGEIEIGLIFNPPYQVLDAALEAIASGIRQLVIVSEGVPPLDMVYLLKKAQETNTLILGSGSQGLIVPDKFWLGTCEAQFYQSGSVGLISRSDRLTDDVARELTQTGLGQSLAVCLGTDGIIGSNFEQWLQILEEDETTEAIVLLGQPNSLAEVSAAEYIASAIEKPTVAYIAGFHAPFERYFGNASTMVAEQLSYSVPTTSESQLLDAFTQANVQVAHRPSAIPQLLKASLQVNG